MVWITTEFRCSNGYTQIQLYAFFFCHNELQDGVADLDDKAFTPSEVHDDPIIFEGCAMKSPEATPSGASGSTDRYGAPPPEATKEKEDLLICDLRQNGTDSVHNMRVVNTDAKSHSMKTPEKCLQDVERGNKSMYLEACQSLLPFCRLLWMDLWDWRPQQP